jgi:hypothetical protein
MAVPSVQIKQNDEKVEVFWEIDTEGLYPHFKLYYSAASNMAGEVAFSPTFLNSPSSKYSDKHIMYEFNRGDIGFDTSTGFYMRVKGVATGGGETAGPTRYIPALDEVAGMENVSKLYGYDTNAGVWRKVLVDATGRLDTA